MLFDIGIAGLGLLIIFSVGFGLVVQLASKPRTGWRWLVAAAGWFVGGLVASEVVWGGATVDELEPIIDGLAFDESLLGGVIGGLVAVVGVRLASRSHMTDTSSA